MKRVVFGYEGGFPLEQETLMHIQESYSEDMLQALFTLWELNPKDKYILREATKDEDGWIILAQEILVNAKEGVKKKLQLIRLEKGNPAIKNIKVVDKRLNDGDLEYAEGDPIEKKVYEEFVARFDSTGKYNLNSFIKLSTIHELKEKVDENKNEIASVKENYLPRNGSKPMTGDLNLGSNQISKLDTNEMFSARIRAADLLFGYSERRGAFYPDFPLGRALVDGGDTLSINHADSKSSTSKGDWGKTRINGDLYFPHVKESVSQTPLVIDSNGNVGKNPNGINSNTTSFSPGMVMMWSGDENNVPSDWVLCDGRANINGVKIPDLRGRFVVGYDSNSSKTPKDNQTKDVLNYGEIHNKGGKKSVILDINEIPSHSHTVLASSDYWGVEPRGKGDNHQRALPPGNKSTGSTGGGQSHENRPPYYVLAFIIYIGDFNAKPIASITYNDFTKTTKTAIVEEGKTHKVNLLGASSNDPDGGTITNYVWEKCFEEEEWEKIGETQISSLQFEIPANRYGLHYFRLLKVIDSEGTESLESNELHYRINKPVTIPPLAILNVSPNPIIFEDNELEQILYITSSTSWRIDLDVSQPNSSLPFVSYDTFSGNGNKQVKFTIDSANLPNNRPPVNNFLISTTDGSNIVRKLSVSALITLKAVRSDNKPSLCFDLESDVLMASGRSKKLKNIVVGDELRVYNFVNKLPSGGEEFRLLSDLMKDATVKTSKVTDFGTQTVEEYRKITLVNGEILNVTPSHPILASRDEEEVAWLLPDDLRAGYFVVNKEGKLTEIESKRTIRESLEIGVLQLESGDNYFIENIMVHNATILRAVARTASRIEAQPIEEVDIIDKR